MCTIDAIDPCNPISHNFEGNVLWSEQKDMYNADPITTERLVAFISDYYKAFALVKEECQKQDPYLPKPKETKINFEEHFENVKESFTLAEERMKPILPLGPEGQWMSTCEPCAVGKEQKDIIARVRSLDKTTSDEAYLPSKLRLKALKLDIERKEEEKRWKSDKRKEDRLLHKIIFSAVLEELKRKVSRIE
jgi:hypothetical protein